MKLNLQKTKVELVKVLTNSLTTLLGTTKDATVREKNEGSIFTAIDSELIKWQYIPKKNKSLLIVVVACKILNGHYLVNGNKRLAYLFLTEAFKENKFYLSLTGKEMIEFVKILEEHSDFYFGCGQIYKTISKKLLPLNSGTNHYHLFKNWEKEIQEVIEFLEKN